MGIAGYEVRSANYILRFSIIMFMGIIAMGSVLFWRTSLMFAAEYQEMPVTHEQLAVKKANEAKQKTMAQKLQSQMLKKYQIEE